MTSLQVPAPAASKSVSRQTVANTDSDLLLDLAGKGHKSAKHIKSSVDALKQKSATEPRGILSIWLQNLRICVSTADLKRLFKINLTEMQFYLRIVYEDQIRLTPLIGRMEPPFRVYLDEAKHIIIHPAEDLDKNVAFELLACPSNMPLMHIIICRGSLGILMALGHTVGHRHIAMKGGEKKKKVVAYLEYEFEFSYGIFGYCCSNQLYDGVKPPETQCEQSLFYRTPPVSSRVDTLNDVIHCHHVGQPEFIRFFNKAELGVPLDAVEKQEHYKISAKMVPILAEKLNRSFVPKTEYLLQLDSRKKRIKYLKNLSFKSSLLTPVDDNHIMVNESFMSEQFKEPMMTPSNADMTTLENSKSLQRFQTSILDSFRNFFSNLGARFFPKEEEEIEADN